MPCISLPAAVGSMAGAAPALAAAAAAPPTPAAAPRPAAAAAAALLGVGAAVAFGVVGAAVSTLPLADWAEGGAVRVGPEADVPWGELATAWPFPEKQVTQDSAVPGCSLVQAHEKLR